MRRMARAAFLADAEAILTEAWGEPQGTTWGPFLVGDVGRDLHAHWLAGLDPSNAADLLVEIAG